MTDTLLEVRNLHVNFYLTEGTVHAVAGVNLSLQNGKTLGVVGESGCGKSVTARAILNMVQRPGRIDQGEILWYGDPDHPLDIASLDPKGQETRNLRWGEIAIIFQEPMTSLSPVHTIGNQMIEAIRPASQCRHGRSHRTFHRAAEPRRPRAAGAPAAYLSPRTQRRHAPARHDRHGPHLQPAPAHR